MFQENLAIKTRKCKICEQEKIPADYPSPHIVSGKISLRCKACLNKLSKEKREKQWGRSDGRRLRHPWTG